MIIISKIDLPTLLFGNFMEPHAVDKLYMELEDSLIL